MRGLNPGVKRVALFQRVVEPDRGAHFHGVGGYPADGEVEFDHIGGTGKGRVVGVFVAQRKHETFVPGHAVPDLRRAFVARTCRVSHHTHGLIGDVDGLRGIDRLGVGLGDHCCDALADQMDLTIGKQWVWRLDHRRAVTLLALHGNR